MPDKQSTSGKRPAESIPKMNEYLKIGATRNNPAVESINQNKDNDMKTYIVKQMEKKLAAEVGESHFASIYKDTPISFKK